MAKLLGTAPFQAPTNADLGDLAYVDMDKIPTVNVGDGTLVVENGNVDVTGTVTAVQITSNGAVIATGAGSFGDEVDIAGDLIVDTDTLFVDAATNRVGIGTSSPTNLLDVNDDSIRIRTAKTPSSASDTGTTGQIAWDADYIYVCTATDTWKRVAIATW